MSKQTRSAKTQWLEPGWNHQPLDQIARDVVPSAMLPLDEGAASIIYLRSRPQSIFFSVSKAHSQNRQNMCQIVSHELPILKI